MERDLSSYRDRAQASMSSGAADTGKGKFVKRLFGLTAAQKERGAVRKEHVRSMLNSQRDFVRSHDKETRELLKNFDKGRLDEFKRFGISEYEYETKPQIARRKVEARLKRERMRKLHDMKMSYNQEWKKKEKALKNPESSPNKPGMS